LIKLRVIKSFLSLLLSLAPSIAWSLPANLSSLVGNYTSETLQLFALLTVLSLAPSILIMVTSFSRIVIVLSFLRSALGLQQSPPNSVLISLSLFLTFYIMTPTFQVAYKEGVVPLVENRLSEEEAFTKIARPFKNFLI
jgi:flagellar biosynthetic protein FliP